MKKEILGQKKLSRKERLRNINNIDRSEKSIITFILTFMFVILLIALGMWIL